MLANTMMVGQVGLAVAPLYLQKDALELVGDTEFEADAPFLKPFEDSIREMREDLMERTSGGVRKMSAHDRTTYRLHVADVMKRFHVDQSGTIAGMFAAQKHRAVLVPRRDAKKRKGES